MKSKKRSVMFIHGAWASCQGFKYISTEIEKELRDHIKHIIFFEYDCTKIPIETVVRKANKELDKQEEETIVIGHSMGGLIALAISDNPKCSQVITLASPISGIKIDRIFQPFVYLRSPLLAELSPDSSFVRGLHKKTYKKRINCIITTNGFNPLLLEKSDGVVTVYSQEKWLPETAKTTYVSNNHHEILQSDQALKVIKKAITNQ